MPLAIATRRVALPVSHQRRRQPSYLQFIQSAVQIDLDGTCMPPGTIAPPAGQAADDKTFAVRIALTSHVSLRTTRSVTRPVHSDLTI
jgi:hypothetical protein